MWQPKHLSHNLKIMDEKCTYPLMNDMTNKCNIWIEDNFAMFEWNETIIVAKQRLVGLVQGCSNSVNQCCE